MVNQNIGLVIAFKGTNYGMHLQGYATQQILESWGYKTTIIDYKHKKLNLVRFDIGLIPHIINQRINNLRKKNIQSVSSNLHVDNIKQRKIASLNFQNEMLKNIQTVYGYKALKEFAKSCDSVLIGSDQMWLPGVSFGNFLSLRFVPDEINKISYATSLGVSSYPRYLYRSSRIMWNRINYLSTREEEGKNVIKTICPNKNVKVVADPTYLLTKEEWLEKIPSKKIVEGKYILCYFLGNNINSLESIKRYSKFKGVKLVSILSNESCCSIDTTFCDELITGASVQDFVNLIRGAECIFTDSFHGLAFSVINEKQFYVYYRKRDDAKESRNSRIDNILRTWEIQDRLITNDNICWEEFKENPINYEKVSKIVSSFRTESLNWLKNALNNEK